MLDFNSQLLQKVSKNRDSLNDIELLVSIKILQKNMAFLGNLNQLNTIAKTEPKSAENFQENLIKDPSKSQNELDIIRNLKIEDSEIGYEDELDEDSSKLHKSDYQNKYYMRMNNNKKLGNTSVQEKPKPKKLHWKQRLK